VEKYEQHSENQLKKEFLNARKASYLDDTTKKCYKHYVRFHFIPLSLSVIVSSGLRIG
jgi:hypothetical protein